MKRNIILAGVGGQGILTMATVIGYAAVKRNLFLKQSEVHGMSQRGGDVQSHLRISDKEIFSDLIPEGKADMIISLEPMEALRHASYLKPDGWIISNKQPFVNIPDYPAIEEIWSEIEQRPRNILLDGDNVARKVANAKSVNIVILGAASLSLEFLVGEMEDALRAIFARKGESVIEANLRAFHAGRSFTETRLLQHA